MYYVYNICGGTLYEGKSLNKAIEATCDAFAKPYVHCKTGKRPVVEDDDGNMILGDYSESYDELKNKLIGIA